MGKSFLFTPSFSGRMNVVKSQSSLRLSQAWPLSRAGWCRQGLLQLQARWLFLAEMLNSFPDRNVSFIFASLLLEQNGRLLSAQFFYGLICMATLRTGHSWFQWFPVKGAHVTEPPVAGVLPLGLLPAMIEATSSGMSRFKIQHNTGY